MQGDTFELGIENLLDLLGEKGNQVQEKYGDADPLDGGDQTATPSLGEYPLQCERDEQDQPAVTGSTRLMIGNGECKEGHHRGEGLGIT